MRSCRVLAGWIGLLFAFGPARAEEDLVLVPEMQPPQGILFEPAARRRELDGRPEAPRALDLLRKRVAQLWPRLCEVDLAELSRHHVEMTRGFRLPGEPGELEGRVIGRDAKDGRLYLELRGPRLPARFAIVFRYLYIYSSFEPATGTLGPLVVTIRGWVEE